MPGEPIIFKEQYKDNDNYYYNQRKFKKMASLDTFLALRNFVRGKLDRWELEESDPLIYNVREKEKRGESTIEIRFDDEEKFLRSLNLSDDDAWFIRAVTSSYSNYEFTDSYSTRDEFMNGYGVWYYFDDENKELLENISKLVYPKKFDLDADDFKEEFAKKLETLFPRQIDSILSDYEHERNTELSTSINDAIRDDFDNAFEKLGLELIPYEGFKTTVGDLFSLYLQYNVIHLDLKGLLKTIFKGKDLNLGGWYDSYWEYSNDKNFDSNSFNKSANKELEHIWEKLSEDFDNEEGRSFLEMIDRLSEKYNLGVWYTLPKDNRFKFRIEGFDTKEYKIEVYLQKPDGQMKKIVTTEKNFNNLLYQPELFDLADI